MIERSALRFAAGAAALALLVSTPGVARTAQTAADVPPPVYVMPEAGEDGTAPAVARHAVEPPPSGGGAQTGHPPESSAPGSVMLSATDREFIETALRDGIAELNEARLAQVRAGNPELREVAARLERDQAETNRAIKRLAAEHGMEVPTEASDARRELYERLQRLEGAEFDAAFLPAASEAHRRGIELYEDAARHSGNAKIRELATGIAPQAREHFALLKGLAGGTPGQG